MGSSEQLRKFSCSLVRDRNGIFIIQFVLKETDSETNHNSGLLDSDFYESDLGSQSNHLSFA